MIVRRYKRGINKYEHPKEHGTMKRRRKLVHNASSLRATIARSSVFSIFGCYYICVCMYMCDCNFLCFLKLTCCVVREDYRCVSCVEISNRSHNNAENGVYREF